MGSRRILDSLIGRKVAADDEMTWEGDWDDMFVPVTDGKKSDLAGPKPPSVKNCNTTPDQQNRLIDGAAKRQLFDSSPTQFKPPSRTAGLRTPMEDSQRSVSPIGSVQSFQQRGYLSPSSRQSMEDLHNRGYSSPNNLRSSPHSDLILASSPVRRSVSLHTPKASQTPRSPGSVYMRGKSPSVIGKGPKWSPVKSSVSVPNLEELMKSVNVDDDVPNVEVTEDLPTCDNTSASQDTDNSDINSPPKSPTTENVSVYMRGLPPTKSPPKAVAQHQPQLELQQALVDTEVEFV